MRLRSPPIESNAPPKSAPPCEEGEKGKAAPTNRSTLRAEVNGNIDGVYKELSVQMKRMAQIQQQVDELREKVKGLSE